MDPVKELIDKGWNTVNIKTVSGRKEETIRENVILNEESGQFDFSDMAIQTSSLEKVSEDENTVVLEGDFFILADFVSRYGKIPSITREDSFVEVTITRVN